MKRTALKQSTNYRHRADRHGVDGSRASADVQVLDRGAYRLGYYLATDISERARRSDEPRVDDESLTSTRTNDFC
jgi:hypothetical protein